MTTYPNATHISPHLKWSEVQCPCGCVMPAEVKARFVILGPKFEQLRTLVGTPLSISKGGAYRCVRYNASIGGARQSQHKYGNALDLYSLTVPEYTVAAHAAKVPGINGIGRYITSKFTHIDQRASRARWINP